LHGVVFDILGARAVAGEFSNVIPEIGNEPNNPGSERSRLHAPMIALATLDTAGTPAQNRKSLEVS
jgi:hypothetical protein